MLPMASPSSPSKNFVVPSHSSKTAAKCYLQPALAGNPLSSEDYLALIRSAGCKCDMICQACTEVPVVQAFTRSWSLVSLSSD